MYPSKTNEGQEDFYINIDLHQGFPCPFHFNGLKELIRFIQYDVPQCILENIALVNKPSDLMEWIFNIITACRTVGILIQHLIQIDEK